MRITENIGATLAILLLAICYSEAFNTVAYSRTDKISPSSTTSCQATSCRRTFFTDTVNSLVSTGVTFGVISIVATPSSVLAADDLSMPTEAEQKKLDDVSFFSSFFYYLLNKSISCLCYYYIIIIYPLNRLFAECYVLYHV